MGNVIYATMVSLDGYIEGPNRELDWAIVDEELHTYINDQQRTLGAYLYGRRTYELMAGFWPTADKDPSTPAFLVEFAQLWKQMPKVVFSKTLDTVQWNSRLARDDVAGEIAKLKAQPGQDLAIGGAALAASCMRLGLIDEYQLFVQPVVLGGGTPMFPPLDDRIDLRLVEARTFRSGVVLLRYLPGNEGRTE